MPQRPEFEVAVLGELLDAPRGAHDDVRRGRTLEDVLVLLDGEAPEEVGDADACVCFEDEREKQTVSFYISKKKPENETRNSSPGR